MKNGKLGVCVVGCGDMGTRHAECWSHLAQARVVAVVDSIEERAQKLAHIYSLDAWYTDYRPAVSLEEVDVVSVCVPTCLHPEVTIFAVAHGKHVLCEKPIALTLQDADAMIEAARSNGVKLGLGFMRRHSPVTHALRNWLADGDVGRPVLYCATDVREIRPKREMHDSHANGGPIVDMGVHLFDGWAYLFNSKPVEVFAQGLKLAKERPELAHIREIAYDTAVITACYASGDIGSFVVCWGLPPGVTLPGSPDRILGPDGIIQVEYGLVHQELRVMRERGEWKLISVCEEDMYQLEITDFGRCILEDEPPLTAGEDGKTALHVALAALESLETGQSVLLR